MSKQKRKPLSFSKKYLIVRKTDGRCYYCNVELSVLRTGGRPMHIDHVIPLARGGADDLDNMVAACAECNAKKHVMTGFEFIAHTMGFEIPAWTFHNADWEEIDWEDRPDFLHGINDGDGESGEEYAYEMMIDDDFDDHEPEDAEEDTWVPLGTALAGSITSITEAMRGQE